MTRIKEINSPSPWNMRIWDDDNKEWLGESKPDDLAYYGFDIRGGEVTIFQSMDWVYDQVWGGKNLIWERSTGLTDKNGVEIYEGDIVRRYVGGEFMNCKVKFNKTEAMFQADVFSLIATEVVGNIHENPELLEGEK